MIQLSVAPKVKVGETTLVGYQHQWDSICRSFDKDKGLRQLSKFIKEQFDSSKDVQRITLPDAHATLVMRHCGMNW